MPLTLADLKAIVDSKQFNELIGEIENEFFDVKGQPYQFDAGDYAKRELAKDVTSFANAAGGYLFIGAATKMSSTHPGEEVTELRPFPAGLIDQDRHYKILSEWTHAEPKGIKVEWIPFGEPGKGIAVITIPPQDDRLKPFLITKNIDSGKTTETLLGYAERKRDSTDALSVVELQHAIRIGIRFEQEILGRLDNVESTLESFFRTSGESEAAGKRAEELASRIEFALQHAELQKQRALILAACPTQASEPKTLFVREQDSIRSRLANPPELRYSGWGLGTRDQPHTIEGKLVRVVNGSRKVLDLYRDGCLIFAGLAGAEFLAWGMNEERKLNSLAVIELVLNFTRFYELVLEDMRERPAEVVFHIELRNTHLEGAKTFLAPYGVSSFEFATASGAKEAPTDSWSNALIVKTDQYDADLVAYEIVRELYVWFGHEENAIPYTTTDGGTRKIDAAQIIRS